MNILMLSRYTQLGASSRMRFYQYFPWLEKAGIRVTEAPFLSDEYVRGLQQNNKNKYEALRAYLKRIRILLGSRQYDLIWIEKEALPWLPAWFERMLLAKNVPYVLDYDDAVFHYYDEHRNRLIKTIFANKHPALMRGAALVVAGNDYLAQFARQAGAKRVEVVPTVVDLTRYSSSALYRRIENKPPCIGWIGQRATAYFLLPYKALFARFVTQGKASFSAIGIDTQALDLPMAAIPWSASTEVDSISNFDIGIMPLVDAAFERGKCGYKLIQYMACGLPVVASPVGVNCRIVEHGVNGFLAETPQQWEDALQILLDDEALRKRMGQAGREKVERQYCLQRTEPQLVQLFIEVVENA